MMYPPLNAGKLIEHLCNDADIGSFVYNEHFQIIEWGRFLTELTGTPREECIGRNINEVLQLRGAPDKAFLFQKALDGASYILRSVQLICNSSRVGILNFDLHLFPMEGANQLITTVLVIATLSEPSRKKIKQSVVRATLTNIDDFLTYAPIPIFIVDEQLNLSLANKAFYAFVRQEPEGTSNLRDFVPPRILDHLQKYIQHVILTGKPLSLLDEYQLHRGSRLLFNIIFPVRGNDGKINAIGGYLIDMTRQAKQQKQNERLLEETLQLNEKLHEQNQELQQKKEALDQANIGLKDQKEELERVVAELSDRNYELDQIMYKTSHDLRAPLTSILGLLQLVKQEKDSSKIPEYHQYIENRVSKLDDFVKTMLTYAKSSRTEINLATIDWQKLVDESLEQVQYLDHYKDISIDININTGQYPFQSDPMRINIILNNLLGNAIKYADMRKEKPCVKVQINTSARGASIEVEDNGIGIPRLYIDKVCDMFFRATDRSEGSGLGLYIVKQTIDRLQGTLTIESQEREGTTIAAILPHLVKQPALQSRHMQPNSKSSKKKI